jgi:hypothetical protein
MKTPLSLYLVAAVAGTLACSDEGGKDRNDGGSAGQTAQAGAGGGGNGGSSGGMQGGAGTSASGSGGGTSTVTRGAALTISAINENNNVPIADANGTSGINGAAYVVASMNMAGMVTTPATLSGTGDKVCIAGNTVPVPMGAMGDNYTEYWGAEIDFDLNRIADPDAPVADAGAADAGGDAGAPVLGAIAGAWTPGAVKGFSFVVTGNDMALPGGGIPAAFRFKSRPFGAPTSENFCFNMTPMSGVVNDVLFTDIRWDCWNSPSEASSIFQSTMGAGAPYTQLQNLGWQIPASPAITLNFNFCVSDIKPIL